MPAITAVGRRGREHEIHPAFGQQALAVRDAAIAQKLAEARIIARGRVHDRPADHRAPGIEFGGQAGHAERLDQAALDERSEEHTSELQSLMRISYAVFCLKKKKRA